MSLLFDFGELERVSASVHSPKQWAHNRVIPMSSIVSTEPTRPRLSCCDEVTKDANREPIIIQGGMGAAVSAWQLARAVSLTGQLGVVSGTALDVVLARRLQLGDPGGHMRRGLGAFPFKAAAQRILDRYSILGGKGPGQPFRPTSMLSVNPPAEQTELIVAANFVEVHLAKEGHDGLIGVNYLEKIQLPTLASLYGAMLAGVDYVLMGAGIPRTIPGALDQFSRGEPAELSVYVAGAEQGEHDGFAVRSPDVLRRTAAGTEASQVFGDCGLGDVGDHARPQGQRSRRRIRRRGTDGRRTQRPAPR